MPDATRESAVLGRVVALGSELPGAVVEDLACRIERVSTVEGADRAAVLAAVSQPAVRQRVGELLDLWHALGLGTTAVLAWSLRAAHAADAERRRRQRVELVWTGPTRHGTALRRTDQALLDLVRETRARILIVSFAVYRAAAVQDALLAAAARGVAVDFVFETPEESDGKIAVDPRRSLSPELLRKSTLWVWPLEVRGRDERNHFGTLHAKCALADGDRLLVSSANFTTSALSLNMELGVLVEGGDMPREVEEHFETLMRDGVLRRG
jgi:phosphatidylserine/phosphatidylglycerophosphate/cardiolipin synthase-like enzyme